MCHQAGVEERRASTCLRHAEHVEAGGLEEPEECPGHSRSGWGTAQVSAPPSLPVGDRELPTSSQGQEAQPCLHTHHCPSPLSADCPPARLQSRVAMPQHLPASHPLTHSAITLTSWHPSSASEIWPGCQQDPLLTCAPVAFYGALSTTLPSYSGFPSCSLSWHFLLHLCYSQCAHMGGLSSLCLQTCSSSPQSSPYQVPAATITISMISASWLTVPSSQQ